MPGIHTSTGPVRKQPVQAARSVRDLPSGDYRQAPSDPILLSAIKNPLIFRTQLWQLNGGKGRCGFQDKFHVGLIPSRFIVSHGVIVELSKEIGELRGVLEREREMGRN